MNITSNVTTSSQPSLTAHIANCNHRVKVYTINDEKIVYLKNKQKFQIELYNGKTTRVLAKIELNGVLIHSGGIILRPGERVFLERFLDTNNAFVFEEYKVEDSKDSREAIALNGLVQVSFYNEELPIRIPNLPYTPYEPRISSEPIWITNSPSSTCLGFCYFDSSLENKNIDVTYTNTNANAKSMDQTLTSNSLSTGRVEKGDETQQVLLESTGQFTNYATKVVKYKILPHSQQNITQQDIRNYCTQCGKKQKKSNKFCPICGTQII